MIHPGKLTRAFFAVLGVAFSAQAQTPPWLQIALTNASPQIIISGATGYVRQVQWAAPLTSGSNAWQVLTNLTVSTTPFAWVDTSASGLAERYFRVVILTNGQPANPDPVRLVWIPPGTFTLGSPESEPERSPNEGPQTGVTLTKGFFMSKYLVTQGDYLGIVGSNPSRFTGDTNRPVERVTWFNSSNYCALLTQSEQAAGRLPAGWRYRLPTEAEWEYACRAGTTTMFSYGDDPNYVALGAYAWFEANSGFTTHPVGQKLPNPWGLYDMHGNLAQWCSDWYASTLPGGNVTDPTGPAGPSVSRVIRGAGYFYSASACRSAYRYPWVPAGSDNSIGFRVVLAASQ
jgi:formylglycine-generating enzyme required for sulfatase activity